MIAPSQSVKKNKHPTIFMMDLLATVPYYTAYLAKALLANRANLTVGSITYYLDPTCFSSRNIVLRPGISDHVGKLHLARGLRRVAKLAETMLNLLALTARFLVRCPDVVHVQYLPMIRWPLPLDLWFVLFCKARGASIVLTVHDLLPHDTADTHKLLFQRLYQRVDAIICHSHAISTRLEQDFGISPEIISVIPHGPFFYDLPSEAALSSATKPQIVLWQGILLPYKGVDLLLEAWKHVEGAGCLAELHIVGTGAPELLASLRLQATCLGLQRVHMDFRFISAKELITAYRAADVVVYPYRAITTSGALATGLALGKAMVASDLPVFKELLTDGENALLVDPTHAEDLANALLTLLGDAAMRSRFAQKIAAMNFGDASWQSIAASTAQVYDTVNRRSGPTCP